ncbi:MAG: tetratricopeptide repeat protein, partial [Acidobacteriota bacterium]
LARLGPAADAWDEVLAEGAALAEELEAAHPAAAARAWHLVGTWRRDHAQNRDGAARAFDRAVALAPNDTSAAQQLDQLLRAEGRWIDLAALLLQRADVEPDLGRRGELLAELGDLYEHYLAQPADALACYERARVDQPDSRDVLLALRRLYRANAAWSQLGELLRELIDTYDPASERAELVDLHVELGGVLADQLAKPEDAVRELRAALELEPRHPTAFRALAAIYQATGQADALLDATEDEVDAATRGDQLQRYPDVARGWFERGRFDRAAACWHKLIALDPKLLAAHEGLSAALRADEQWSALAAVLRARLELVADPAARVALLLELGELLDTRLDESDAAAAAYEGALAIDPKHRGALDALARLHDRAGRLQPVIAVLQRLLEQTPVETAAARADVFQRLGHAYLNARDVATARSNLKTALGLDLSNAGAHEGMARMHLMQDEVVSAGEELVRAAELSTDPGERIRRLADAAWVFRHRLHETERARQCLALILELEPEHTDAKAALAELLHDTKQWQELWPHLEQEIARVDADASLPAGERADVYTRAARCALELDSFGRAMELYDRACALDPGVPLQLERAEALARSKSLDAAATALQTIVLRHAQTLDRGQLVGVYRRLAELHGALGKPAQAQLFHQKVLELAPNDPATLRSQADLHAARGRYDDAVISLRALADASQGAERVAVLEKIGDVYRDKLKNLPRAMSAYLEALELEHGNHRLLQRMLDLQSESGQWKQALETIERFLEHEPDPVRRGAYYVASAEIRRNELRDKPGALDAYERALDELFRQQPPSAAARTRGLDTFRTVDEMLTADRAWATQEHTYRRMIKRIAQDDPALIALWHALGEIYRTRLKQYQGAIEAFEVAHALDPAKSADRASILAELYALVGKKRPQEVPQRAAKLVETAPTNPDAYRALGKTVVETSRGVDEAWCVARALVVLKQANAEEAALYKRYQAHEVRKATGILDEQAWANVRHADEDRAISAIFALVWEAPVALRAGPAKAFELKPKERMPVEDGTRVLAKIFRHAARVLNVGLPDVYVQPRRPGRLLLANCIEKGRLMPAVIVGRDLMTGYRDTEIAAAVGAMLALLRPAYYLKLALPSVDELEAALGAAAQLVGHPWVGRGELEPLRAAFVAEMKKRLNRRSAEALIALAGRLPERPDLARWREAVDAAAQRAGLLVSGELAASTRMLSTEAGALGGPRPAQRVEDLVSYSVSPSYFAVRSHLGITVG